MKSYRRLVTLAAAAIFALTAGASAIADDTEIFLAQPTGTPPRPNVLIIIDTSGSMGTEVSIRPAFDPAGSYTGTCDESRVYWKKAGSGATTPPACDTTRWVSAANQLCKTVTDGLAQKGSTSTKFVGQWLTDNVVDNRKWTSPAAGRDSYIECKADQAIGHGSADGDNLVPANKSFGPYANDTARVIDWTGDDVNDTYIFYTGKWLNWYNNTPVSATKSRIDIVKESAIDLVNGSSLNGTNVALMRYNSAYHNSAYGTIRSGANDHYRGGRVIKEFADIESSRAALVTAIENLTADGYTPLSETLFEAYRYYSGGAAVFGSSSIGTASIAASMSGGNYISPITASCQQNFIIFLTDGAPTDDMEAETMIEGSSVLNAQCDDNDTGADSSAETGDGICLDDLAGYMNAKDFFGTAASSEPKENVRTFMIGFGDSLPAASQLYLEETATAGGGEAFSATDPVSLAEAFENIASNIVTDEVSFTAPTVSVNAFNRTRNLNDLFFTVFEPAQSLHWPGNLKKYRIDAGGVIKGYGSEDSAVDSTKGFFDTAARSYWSDSVDGRTVTLGGAAHELPDPSARDLYTDVSSNNLSAATNRILGTNTAITRTLLGLAAEATAGSPTAAEIAERLAMINWVRGIDVDDEDKDTSSTDTRFVMGDPLHARPVSVIYGGTADAPEAVVFAATNDGFLHAFDPYNVRTNTTNPGAAEELWAYLPSQLMPRLRNLRTVTSSSAKGYALDGNIVAYKIDVDNDGIVESADGDKVLLFFGMGRGGSSYYALDVTDKNAPQLLWRKSATDTGMSALGQTWSTPVVTKVKVKPDATGAAAERLVVIFGGGYDPTQDGGATASTHANYRTDASGRAIFMLDAYTGDKIWSQGYVAPTTPASRFTKMTNAFPGDVRVIDLTGDGLADRMYAGDMGGRIWRFDILNGDVEGANLVRGGVFASLGRGDGAGDLALDARRFYTAPDVSIAKVNGVQVLNIAIGSGFRGHPLNKGVNDRFYSLRDTIPFRAMTEAEYDTMNADPIVDNESETPPDLVNVTTIAAPTIPATAKGWKINFTNGEKVLSDAVTFDGQILFSTFKPAGNVSSSTCAASAGTNTFYAVNASDASPVTNRDGDATIDVDDRGQELEQGGIAPPPVILFPTPETTCTGAACSPPPVCLVGPEACGVSFTNDPVKTFWMQKNAD